MGNFFRLSVAQVLTMLQLQDRLNSKINPEWYTAGNAWYRAIWIECAEMMEHIGWKWWKKQETNVAQVKLELVDIWHFILSITLEDMHQLKWPHEKMAETLVEIIDDAEDDFTLPFQAIEDLVHHATADRLAGDAFIYLCKHFQLSGDELYRLYISKNVLNIFRQDNGYKDGTYRKHWYDGREDNEHLNDIFAEYPNITPDELLGRLHSRYCDATYVTPVSDLPTA